MNKMKNKWNVIIYIIILINIKIFSQPLGTIYFEDMIYNVEQLNVSTYENQSIVVGRQKTKKGDTLVVSKIIDNEKIIWKVKYGYEGNSIYVQNIIYNGETIVVLAKIETVTNYLKNNREENNGLILCFNKFGELLWNKNTIYIPMSALLTNIKSLIICYADNYTDGVNKNSNLGLSKFDLEGKELKNLLLKEPVSYTSKIFLRFLNDSKKIEIFFNIEYGNNEKAIKKIYVDDSFDVIQKCTVPSNFYIIGKSEIDNKDIIVESYFDKVTRKKNIHIKYFNCDYANDSLPIENTFNIGTSISVVKKFVFISENDFLTIYELNNSNSKWSLKYKADINAERLHEFFSVNDQNRINIWFLKSLPAAKDEPFKCVLGVSELSISTECTRN